MKMLLGQNSDSLNNGIQGLIDYCSKNFDKAIIQYCGHGEQYSGRKTYIYLIIILLKKQSFACRK